jgi:signal transduction histidine kinase
MKELLPSWEIEKKSDGFLISVNQRCKNCVYNECKNIKSNDTLFECPHGFNYIKSESKIFFGILVFDKNPSKQKRESMYKFSDCVIAKSIYENFILFRKNINEDVKINIANEKIEIINNYIQKNLYKDEYFAEIKKIADTNFSFFHDYQQINGTINRNINVIIRNKTNCNDEITDEVLNRCNQNEVAIYYASQILEEKLNVAKAMRDFSWLNRASENNRFSVYGCVLKYVRMYKSISDQKNIHINVLGKSFKEIVKNSRAFSIIPHTFIDNAIKYSPKYSEITVYVNDEHGFIDFYVKSLGPKINDRENEKIFSPFFRGDSAKKLEEDGSGYGLYVAQKIAKEHLNSLICVKQNESLKDKYFETTFSLKIFLD